MINYWMSISGSLHDDITAYLADPDNYDGATDVGHLEGFAPSVMDAHTVTCKFIPHSNTYLYSLYVENQELFDMLITAYPSTVLGSWGMDGLRMTDLHAELINYMPLGSLEDVILLGGQQPRDFS